MSLPKQVNTDSVVVVIPRYFEEEQQMRPIITRRVVIVDLKYVDTSIKQRMVAFLEGTYLVLMAS
jgi:FtsZ-interacting cell division protein YlmF